MYTVVGAIGVPFGLNKRWQVVDLAAYTMAELYASFREVQIELKPEPSAASVYLDLQDVAPTYASSTSKFSVILAELGEASLPTKDTGIVLKHRKAYFRDAIRANYRITPVNQVNQIDTSVDSRQLPNIRLTRIDSDIDYTYLFNHCLVSVNGFYHLTDTDGQNGLMVKDAMKSLVLANQDQVGLLSFSGMCQIKPVRILPSMVDTTVLGKPVVSLDENLTNKHVLFVIGGYMTLVDGGAVSQVGASRFKIDFTQLDVVSRYHESKRFIDLSRLNVPTSAANPNLITQDDLLKDEVLLGWLTLSQSFAVVLDTPSLYWQKQYVARSGLPGIYFNYTQPNDPLVMELGSHPSYWVSYEDAQWRLSIYNNVIGNSLYYTKTVNSDDLTAGNVLAGSPSRVQKAYLLELGRDH